MNEIKKIQHSQKHNYKVSSKRNYKKRKAAQQIESGFFYIKIFIHEHDKKQNLIRNKNRKPRIQKMMNMNQTK